MLSRPLHSSVTFLEETAPVKLPDMHCPSPGFTGIEVRPQTYTGWYFTLWLFPGRNRDVKASHLCYAVNARGQYKSIVKVHGVFPSCCGEAASSPPLLFHRVGRGDSAPVITLFMRVGTYPTRNFATLGPLELQPLFR